MTGAFWKLASFERATFEAFRFFSSLKLAVVSILSLAVILAGGTVVESLYGMRSAHLLIYGTWWFYGVLFFLGTNVFCAALSRYPWKRHQIGFVLTHAGILTVLLGSFLTMRFGVDGSMPVTEGSAGNEMYLPEPELVVVDEETERRSRYAVPESVTEKRGRVLEISLGHSSKLAIDHYIPRALTSRVISPSPIEGLGRPAVRVELFNDQVHIDEWLIHDHPGRAKELPLGPAVISFNKLWTKDAEKSFLDPPGPKPAAPGTLTVNYRGERFELAVDPTLSSWSPLGKTGFEIRIARFLPHAVVENGKLISRSRNPVNPAVDLLVRRGLKELEKHTVFSNFPEFSTLHRKHQNKNTGENELGLQFRLAWGAQAIAAEKTGRLELVQTADDKRLLYRVFGKNGNTKGKVTIGSVIGTGWMDLGFKVSEWIPSAVEEYVPRSIEFLSGSDSEYPSAIHLRTESTRGIASDSGYWLTEGVSRTLTVGKRRIQVQYGRRRMVLPFSIHLEKFTMGTDPGTQRAASYESVITVKDPESNSEPKVTISMNEPLQQGRYTFYQASYQQGAGKTMISIFAVNYDPGRFVKYGGALLMVLGILVMFYMNPHYWDKMLGVRKI